MLHPSWRNHWLKWKVLSCVITNAESLLHSQYALWELQQDSPFHYLQPRLMVDKLVIHPVKVKWKANLFGHSSIDLLHHLRNVTHFLRCDWVMKHTEVILFKDAQTASFIKSFTMAQLNWHNPNWSWTVVVARCHGLSTEEIPLFKNTFTSVPADIAQWSSRHTEQRD